MPKAIIFLFFLFSCSDVHGQPNLYVSNNISTMLRWPIVEHGNHVYFLSNSFDTAANGLGSRNYYFSSVDKYNYALVKSVLILRDTAFNVYEPFQVVNVSYSFNPATKKFNFFTITDVDSSKTAGSQILEYPKTIGFLQLDTSLNTVIPSKPILQFNQLSRYALSGLGFSQSAKNTNQTIACYRVRDTLISVSFNLLSSASKFLIVDDTGKLLTDEFLGYEPMGNGTFFPDHSSFDDFYKKDDNTYAALVDFMDSNFFRVYSLLILDSNLHIIDTFEHPYSIRPRPSKSGQLNVGFGGYANTFFFLPTGSLIRSSLGSYVDSSSNTEYIFYGVGKGTLANGYRPELVYFPPESDTADLFHSSNNAFIGATYSSYDNRIYAFTSTKSDYNGDYCLNGQPNLGQIACIDTALAEKWVKYIRPRPGYCIQSFCVAAPDRRNGVLISGREFSLADPNNQSFWKPFIYHIDSATRLGVNSPEYPVIISDQFTIYPNPAADYVTIDNVLGGRYSYTVVNAVGQVLMSGSSQKVKTELEVRSLPAGVYLVIIQTANKKRFSLKLIVE